MANGGETDVDELVTIVERFLSVILGSSPRMTEREVLYHIGGAIRFTELPPSLAISPGR
jgi:hypothetical protein